MAVRAKIFDGKKFMWDGRVFANQAVSKTAEQTYQKNGFETRIMEEENQYFIYTRREVKEVVVEGSPPP